MTATEKDMIKLEAIEEMSFIVREVCVQIAQAEGHDAAVLLSSIALALTRLNLDQAKAGQEDSAFESMVHVMRALHRRYKAEKQVMAEREAEDARQKGSIQ